jgi:hypothetical protein
MKHGKGGSLLQESFIDRQVRYPIEVTGPALEEHRNEESR